jgi:predicted alpha/beta-fold hydrolase
MTIYSWGRRRRFPNLPEPAERLFDVAEKTRVLAHCYWQNDRAAHPALVALHGLEGSSTAHYMSGMAEKAFARGFNVVLLNQRNCGGTEHLGPGLYHSGLTDDAAHVIGELTAVDRIGAIAIAGYSLGGNLALKLAGDFGPSAPPSLKAVCAVSPIIEIGRCVDQLERWTNRVYQWNFVRDLKKRMCRKAALFPDSYPMEALRSVKTVREFDEAITAPHFGFAGASDYYHRASAMRVIDRVRVPALIVSARNDPFVPADLFDAPAVRQNPWITPVITRYGGHCGFIASSNGCDDGYWA